MTAREKGPAGASTGGAYSFSKSRGYGVWVVVTTPPEIDSELAGSL